MKIESKYTMYIHVIINQEADNIEDESLEVSSKNYESCEDQIACFKKDKVVFSELADKEDFGKCVSDVTQKLVLKSGYTFDEVLRPIILYQNLWQRRKFFLSTRF